MEHLAAYHEFFVLRFYTWKGILVLYLCNILTLALLLGLATAHMFILHILVLFRGQKCSPKRCKSGEIVTLCDLPSAKHYLIFALVNFCLCFRLLIIRFVTLYLSLSLMRANSERRSDFALAAKALQKGLTTNLELKCTKF